jgi:hypothetical protein
MIIFTHVPKTAGSTINRAAAQLLSTAVVGVKRPRDLDDLPDTIRYVGGHVRFADAVERFPEATFIASLRRPLHRVLSHYMMLLRDDPDAPEAVSFSAFYKHHITNKKRDNLQCRFLCGKPDAQQALESIKTNYALVWITERTDEVWPIVREMLTGEWRIETPERVMVAPNAPPDYDDYLSDEDIAFVCADNQQDAILYERIAVEFNGLYVSYSVGRASSLALSLSASA